MVNSSALERPLIPLTAPVVGAGAQVGGHRACRYRVHLPQSVSGLPRPRRTNRPPSFQRVLRTTPQLDEALAAKALTPEQLAEVDAVAPRGAVAGTRYPAALMSALDSERR